MTKRDTIVAIATANQNAGVGIIRLSGPSGLALLKAVFVKPNGSPFLHFEPRRLQFGKIVAADGQPLDEALAVWMPGPNTLTGEDIVELQCHGNVHLLRRVLREILAFSTMLELRAAEPGEFSKRAFLNGKIDLTQAEAIHELIQSQSDAAVAAHLANLDGALARKINAIRADLTLSLALIEASFEFPEEDIQTYDPDQVRALLQNIHVELCELLAAHQTSKLLDEGILVAIVGRPNVGKSSLLNALLREDRAIVADIAGTTRDVVQGTKILAGLRFQFADTAGLRETTNYVEQQGIARSLAAAAKAHLVLQVTDRPLEKPAPYPGKKNLYILNKSDLLTANESVTYRNDFDILICTHQPDHIGALENLIVESLNLKNVQNSVHVNERQYHKLKQANECLVTICTDWEQHAATEILAEEIRHLILCLDEITGKISPDDILGEIFKRFCIGK